MTKLVLGAFSNLDKANEAIMDLEDKGIPLEDFSIIAKEDTQKSSKFKDTVGKVATGSSTGTGAAIGGAAGGLTGLIAGAIGTAGMFVGGPILLLAGLGWVAVTTVTGGAIGAAAGGIVGALIGLGIPENQAKKHAQIVSEGGILLGVEDYELDENEIRQSLQDHGVEEIATIDHGELPAKVTVA